MIQQIIKKLSEGNNLSQEEIQPVIEEIMSGRIDTAAVVSFLTALNKQGITADELVGAARAMRHHMVKIKTRHKVVLDTCGTGGDRKHTFNISTAAAFVAAGAGIAVAKHGNRSVSSLCGSADVLEALGVNINMSKETAQSCLDQAGITFLFAPLYHPAMQYAMPARKEIKDKTIFNFLGPLCNPALANYQLIGAPDKECAHNMALALKELGCVHALVICGRDQMDEITTTSGAETSVYEVRKAKVEDSSISPGDFNFNESGPDAVKGGIAQENAKIFIDILENKEKGAYRDIVLFNAGAAIYVAQAKPARFLKEGISEGIRSAREAIESGKALEKLELLKEYSNK
ncbi:MAG: anthranilate phosphoribosyltransferase [Candidatus Omnitrophica bacterium]|nr:anthranilate phosphoribosyltransferase [Candidatus Omnitrophota bacterium]